MFEPKPIFRKVALERLSSPEQLDVLMQVTSPRSWIALLALGLLLVVVVIWGFVGSIPTKVQAQGILIQPGGVFDVFATGTGQILEVSVAEGDLVETGQVIARIDQPDLTKQITNARAQLEELRTQHRQLISYSARNTTLRDDNLLLQGAKLKDTITFADGRLTALQEQIENQEALLEKGLITKQAVLQSKQEYFATQDLRARTQNELERIPLEQLTTSTSSEQEIVRSQLRINESERNIDLLTRQLELVSNVRSQYTGRILEVKRDRGDIVTAGTPLVNLQLSGNESGGLQAIIYVPPAAGKNVRPGMQAQISPAAVQREEYGFLIGNVTYVSEFPSTYEGMMRVLSNQALVQSLSAQGPPYAVYADLLPNPEAVSGFLWSSTKGNTLKVGSGTLAQVNLTVRERRPIEMVIPIIREYTGL